MIPQARSHTPAISIALATFNGEAYLAEQLRSLGAQRFLPSELVVTDDGSTDATISLLENFAAAAPFAVRIYRNEQRLGYGHNFMRAASLCRGDYVAFCDQDDVWLPEKLECLLASLLLSSADLLTHTARVVDRQLRFLGACYPSIDCDRILGPGEGGNEGFWPGFSLTISRRLLQDAIMRMPAAPAQTLNSFAHDELVCALAKHRGLRALIAKPLALYRQHGNNLIGFHGAINSGAGAFASFGEKA